MKKVGFVKEPGYMYDLLCIFALYFNEEYWETVFINRQKAAEDISFYKKVIEEFGPIPDELRIFFALDTKRNARVFMTKCYFDPFGEEILKGSYNISVLQRELSDYDRVTRNVLEYYFGYAPAEVREECLSSIKTANTLIRESDYDDRTKNALYSFLIDPAAAVQRLTYELITKEFMLSKQYEKHVRELSALKENFDIDAVAEKLKKCNVVTIDLDGFSEVAVSFCINNKNHISARYYGDTVLLSLGFDYEDSLKYLSDDIMEIDLHEFGAAVSEKNRVAILQFIYENKEVTIKEIEQALGLAGTNAYYHLTLMIRTGMLKNRNRGKTILYSINHKYFESLSRAIGKFSVENGSDS